MEFTYKEYKELLIHFKEEGYIFECYDNNSEQYTVICRHDIDTSLEHAVPIAKIEKELGISAVYFILVSTNFYNVFSPSNRIILKQIKALGHKIALHFDASIYQYDNMEDLQKKILKEIEILEAVLDEKIHVVSFHRPVKELFNVDMKDGIISAYAKKYFSGYAYVSDSRRNWRSDPYKILKQKPKNIQLLTHPIWYYDEVPNEASDAIKRLKNKLEAITESSLEENITEYRKLIKEGEEHE